MRKPALLRFESDSFMSDIARQLESDPGGLAANLATPVTYRLPAPGETAPPAPSQLKLFQAVHGHFYLVAATLVCRLPGLPEHEIDTAAGERVRCVLRRLDKTSGAEWGWVADPGAQGGKSWHPITTPQAVAPQEELLPMFPLRYHSDDRLRRLFVGLVPTATAETLKASGALSPLAAPGSGRGAPPADPRPAAFTAKVSDALRQLQASQTEAPAGAPNPAAIRRAMAEQQVEASRFLLLDFAAFLNTNLGWFAARKAPVAGGPAATTLWDQLGAPAVAGGTLSWIEALGIAWSERLVIGGDAPGTSSLTLNLRTPGVSPDELDSWIAAALPPLPPADPSAPAVSIQGDVAPPPPVPKLDSDGTAEYVLRCVYQRPRCGALQPDTVSEPTDQFQIANYHDLDAPARSIVISLPANTGIKDLRKLRKNVSFLLSNELREQLNRVSSLKNALEGQFAEGETLDIGLLCSFSIPVITICAVIVLMIFIDLLNIVFWWLPFLRICFPILRKAD
jgi:hypothetical protein